MAATLPQFLEMEKTHGSLIRGMRQKKPAAKIQNSEFRIQNSSGARYGLFVAPRDGMQRLVDAISARLPAESVRLNSPVERMEQCNGTWQIHCASSDMPEPFDDLVLAAPGAVSSRLLKGIDGDLASLIGQIPHAGCSIASGTSPANRRERSLTAEISAR